MSSIAGIDEAGRGALAGPLVAAAVMLPDNWDSPLRDSKKHTPQQREALYIQIMDRAVVGVSIILADQIDDWGIQRANITAMETAARRMHKKPDKFIVDGNLAVELPRPHECIIRADSLYPCVSAASIVAKVKRDRIMIDMGWVWPDYRFDKHKGYGTAAHVAAIKKHGYCPIHRRSFKLKGWKIEEPEDDTR